MYNNCSANGDVKMSIVELCASLPLAAIYSRTKTLVIPRKSSENFEATFANFTKNGRLSLDKNERLFREDFKLFKSENRKKAFEQTSKRLVTDDKNYTFQLELIKDPEIKQPVTKNSLFFKDSESTLPAEAQRMACDESDAANQSEKEIKETHSSEDSPSSARQQDADGQVSAEGKAENERTCESLSLSVKERQHLTSKGLIEMIDSNTIPAGHMSVLINRALYIDF